MYIGDTNPLILANLKLTNQQHSVYILFISFAFGYCSMRGRKRKTNLHLHPEGAPNPLNKSGERLAYMANTLAERALSRSQEEFLLGVDTGHNIALMSGPGTGKTFTSCLVPFAHFVAFSRDDKAELAGRIPAGSQAVTAHSAGLTVIRGIYRYIRVNPSCDSNLVAQFGPSQGLDRKDFRYAESLISWSKNTLLKLADCVSAIAWPQDVAEGLITCAVNTAHEAMAHTLRLAKSGQLKEVGYDDMPWLPVACNWAKKSFERILVDEFQDQSPCQIELLARLAGYGVEHLSEGDCPPNYAQIILVGDIAQAIYGFRGATGENARNFIARIGAIELPLMLSYRLPQSAVPLLRPFWPALEVPATNPEGSINSLLLGKLEGTCEAGDFVISRTNAPLVSIAIRFLCSGRKAMVVGRDIGQTLISLLKKIEGKRTFKDHTDFLSRLEDWEARESTKVAGKKSTEKAREQALQAVADKAKVFRALAGNCESPREIYTQIEALFLDVSATNADFIRCSTVHKCKGREAKNVFILADTFRQGLEFVPGDEEENCVRGVVLSRHKENLYIVSGLPKDEE